MSVITVNSLVRAVEPPPIASFKDRCRALGTKSAGLLDLSQAVPSVPTFAEIRRRLAEEVLIADEVSSYTDIAGLGELRRLIAETHPLSVSIGADNVLVTAGANHAMYTALTSFVERGATVILPEPFYFNHDMALRMLGIRAVHYPLSSENGFRIRATELSEAALRVGAQGVVLVTPNNPTGACYSAKEIRQLLETVCPRGVQVFLDETYLHQDPEHLKDPGIAAFVGRGLSLIGSFSKSHSLCGYRIGYLITGKASIDEALKVQDTMLICPSHIGQRAAFWGLMHGMGAVRELSAATRRRLELFEHGSRILENFRLVSCGAYFGYVQHPFSNMGSEAAAIALFQRTGILGLPGEIFGSSQKRFIRLALGNADEAVLESALQRLALYDKEISTGIF